MILTYFIFIFTCFNVPFQVCFSYQRYKLESYKLCASKPFKRLYDVISPPEIVLGKGEDSAVIITQTWNSTNASRMRLSCSFQVSSTDPNSEFVIAITKLKFRQSRNGCYDFIQFKHGGTKSEKFCKEIGANYGDVNPIFGKRVKSFRVDVNVEKGIASDDHLELEMVITAGHECLSNWGTSVMDDFQCNEKDRLCISNRFVNDGVLNCFPPCRDEGECFPVATTAQAPDVSSIALSAITSLIFTMIAVGTGAWLCWKYKECFKRTDIPQNATAPPIELPQTSQDSDENNSQSLPRPPSPKDLPPSYESLFPDR